MSRKLLSFLSIANDDLNEALRFLSVDAFWPQVCIPSLLLASKTESLDVPDSENLLVNLQSRQRKNVALQAAVTVIDLCQARQRPEQALIKLTNASVNQLR